MLTIADYRRLIITPYVSKPTNVVLRGLKAWLIDNAQCCVLCGETEYQYSGDHFTLGLLIYRIGYVPGNVFVGHSSCVQYDKHTFPMGTPYQSIIAPNQIRTVWNARDELVSYGNVEHAGIQSTIIFRANRRVY